MRLQRTGSHTITGTIDVVMTNSPLESTIPIADEPIELVVESVDGTWKLNQHKVDEVRLCTAEHVTAGGFGYEVALPAEVMCTTTETR